MSRHPENNNIDQQVGARVRQRRTMLAISQEKLGEAIGLTFQQVQKYERGANRISASMLVRIADVLDAPVSFFFDGLGPNCPPPDDTERNRHLLEMNRHYLSLPMAQRADLLAIAKALNAAYEAGFEVGLRGQRQRDGGTI